MPPLNVNIQLAEVSYDIGTQSTIAIAATAIHEALALLLPKSIYGHVKLRKELRMAEVYLRLDIYFGDLLVLEAELTLRPIPMSLIKNNQLDRIFSSSNSFLFTSSDWEALGCFLSCKKI